MDEEAEGEEVDGAAEIGVRYAEVGEGRPLLERGGRN